MGDIKNIHTEQAKQEFMQVIFQVFGKDFPQENADEWAQMIMDEADSSYDDYCVSAMDAGKLFFGQYGEKEHYHDGSCQPRKFVCVKPISKEEYTQAKKCQCVPDSIYHAYSKGWLDRGEERFLTYWQGRSFDYLFYAKNLAGLSYVMVAIESLY